MSNMELIQSMSRERLAMFLEQYGCPGTGPYVDCVCIGQKEGTINCVECWERWLMREAGK